MFSLWSANTVPFPSFQKKMSQFLNREDVVATSHMINRLNAQPQPHYQPKHKTCQGTTLLKRRAEEKPCVPDTDYLCCVHTFGKVMPPPQNRIPTVGQIRHGVREERQDLGWEADLEKEKDNLARGPLRHPRQLTKVLIYQTRKPPAGWPSGEIMQPASPKSKSETVPKQSSWIWI